MPVKRPPAKILPPAWSVDCLDNIVGVRVERIGQASRAIEPADEIARLSADVCESAARQNLAIRLHHDRLDHVACVRVERISQPARGIEPGDAVARLSADVDELAAHPDFSVRLDCDGKNFIARVRVERIGQAGDGIKPGDAVTRLSADAVRSVERAAHQNLAVRLHRN